MATSGLHIQQHLQRETAPLLGGAPTYFNHPSTKIGEEDEWITLQKIEKQVTPSPFTKNVFFFRMLLFLSVSGFLSTTSLVTYCFGFFWFQNQIDTPYYNIDKARYALSIISIILLSFSIVLSAFYFLHQVFQARNYMRVMLEENQSSRRWKWFSNYFVPFTFNAAFLFVVIPILAIQFICTFLDYQYYWRCPTESFQPICNNIHTSFILQLAGVAGGIVNYFLFSILFASDFSLNLVNQNFKPIKIAQTKRVGSTE